MKFTKRICSVMLSLLLLVAMFPTTMHAANTASLKITTQPKTSYTAYGNTAKVTIKANGDHLKYTWYVKKSNSKTYIKSSITKSTYSVKMTSSSKDSKVYCVVTDRKGKSIKSNVATLRMKATITTQPQTAYVKKGETAKVSFKAKGDGLKYTWYYKNSGTTKYKKSSINKATYSVKLTDKVHGRKVYCVVTDKYGNRVTTKSVELRQSVAIVGQPQSATAELGKKVKVSVKAEGKGLKYTWYYKNKGSSKYSKSSITNADYSVTMTDKVNGRKVYCVVTDKYGKTEKSKTVSISERVNPLTIIWQPQNTSAVVGDEVGFGIEVTGGKVPYTYQLKRSDYNGDEISWETVKNVEVFRTGNIAELVFKPTFEEDYYYCIIVTDAVGKKVTSNVVHIEEEVPRDSLMITKQPDNTIASAGDTVGFGIGVIGGVAPYTYQLKYTYNGIDGWKDMEAEILTMGSMTELTFCVTEQSLREQFIYCILITDATGEQIYSNMVHVDPLETTNELEITTQPQNFAAQVGETASFTIVVDGGETPYKYQWQYAADTMPWTDIAGWTNGQSDTLTLVVYDNEFTNHYIYRCKITDAQGDIIYSDEVYVIRG